MAVKLRPMLRRRNEGNEEKLSKKQRINDIIDYDLETIKIIHKKITSSSVTFGLLFGTFLFSTSFCLSKSWIYK